MKQSLYLAAFALSCVFGNANAQLVINGSFDPNSGECAPNKQNADFNALIGNMTAYGPASQLDLLKDICGYGPAQDGLFYLGIGTDTLRQHDALSLALSAPLTIGRPYRLSYYVRKAVDYHATSYTIGYATLPGVSGITLTDGPAPDDTAWQLREATFTPTTAANYLTIEATGNLMSWTHIDHVSLTEAPAGVLGTALPVPMPAVYPNPASGFATIELAPPFGREAVISLTDLTGRLIRTMTVQHATSARIGLGDIAPGVYIIKVSNAKAVASARIVVSG
jgi:hypothetical protein